MPHAGHMAHNIHFKLSTKSWWSNHIRTVLSAFIHAVFLALTHSTVLQLHDMTRMQMHRHACAIASILERDISTFLSVTDTHVRMYVCIIAIIDPGLFASWYKNIYTCIHALVVELRIVWWWLLSLVWCGTKMVVHRTILVPDWPPVKITHIVVWLSCDTVTLQVATAIGHSTIVYTIPRVYTYMCRQLQYWLCVCVSEKLKDVSK